MEISAHSTVGPLPLKEKMLKQVVRQVLRSEHPELTGELRFIFVDNAYIQRLNRQFLQHDYATDVIAFPLEADDSFLDGEVYISVERAREQARSLNVDLNEELWRLVLHGLLHLLGYDDLTEEERRKMHTLQEHYLEELGLKRKEK